jgi:hypothetical protein
VTDQQRSTPPLILTVIYERCEERLEVTYSHPRHDDRAAFVAFPGPEPEARAAFAAWLADTSAPPVDPAA